MNAFKIDTNPCKITSINRTIRLKPECYERLVELSCKNNISFNKLVNQCIDYALRNLDDA